MTEKKATNILIALFYIFCVCSQQAFADRNSNKTANRTKAHLACATVLAEDMSNPDSDMSNIDSLKRHYTLNDQCIEQVLAERGDAAAKSKAAAFSQEDLPNIQKYATAARTLQEKADKGDISALVRLHRATPQTNPDEYRRRLYSANNIQLPSETDFPVKIFEWDQAPMPTSRMGWKDNETIVYKTREQEKFIALNVRSLARDESLTEEAWKEIIWQNVHFQPDHPGCIQLFDHDGYACYKHTLIDDLKDILYALKIIKKPPFDAKVIHIEKDYAEDKELVFDRPIYPLNFHYDAFSGLYWTASGMKVWQFDRKFHKISEYTYPPGLWGRGTCLESHWHHSWQRPCEFLKFSSKAGFIIGQEVTIVDKDNDRQRLFNAGGTFLLKKDGSAIRIMDAYEQNDGLAVSPDGCQIAFIKDPRSMPKLGIINVCKNIEQEK